MLIILSSIGTKYKIQPNKIRCFGRVLGITSIASKLEIAREKSYESIKKINWPEGFFL